MLPVGRPLGSVADRLTSSGFWLCLTVRLASGLIVGGWAVTLTVKDCVAEKVPSLAVTWMVAGPTQEDEVDWIEASANYVRLHSGKQIYLVREGISHISERLDAERFVRVHRSIIVNVGRVKELQPCNSGEYIVVLKDGQELSCSRGYSAGLRLSLGLRP